MSQTLKFRLQDGHIFDFEYTKYSDFIDNLEPEPGIIIDVLEPFTLEDFEISRVKYQKYSVYREYLDYIETHPKSYSLEKLIELSKYDLNNPVLEWLMIRETSEDKEIKKVILEYLEKIKWKIIFDNLDKYLEKIKCSCLIM